MRRGSSESNKTKDREEPVPPQLRPPSLVFKHLPMLHWSKINLNHPLKDGQHKGALSSKNLGTLQPTWSACPQAAPTGSQAHRGATVHPRQDQRCEKAGAQRKMSCMALLTIWCPCPEHCYHSNLYVLLLATLLLKVSSAAGREKASDLFKNVATTALQKGSFCSWDAYSLRLSVSLGMYLSCATGCQAHLAGPHAVWDLQIIGTVHLFYHSHPTSSQKTPK